MKPTYPCSLCNTQFMMEKALLAHLYQTHERLKIPCDFCDREFTRFADLKRHEVASHLSFTKVHTCPLCDFSSKRRDTVGRHIENQHKVPKDKLPKIPVSVTTNLNQTTTQSATPKVALKPKGSRKRPISKEFITSSESSGNETETEERSSPSKVKTILIATPASMIRPTPPCITISDDDEPSATTTTVNEESNPAPESPPESPYLHTAAPPHNAAPTPHLDAPSPLGLLPSPRPNIRASLTPESPPKLTNPHLAVPTRPNAAPTPHLNRSPQIDLQQAPRPEPAHTATTDGAQNDEEVSNSTPPSQQPEELHHAAPTPHQRRTNATQRRSHGRGPYLNRPGSDGSSHC